MRYQVIQGKDITDADATIDPGKWYVIETRTGRVKAGPYDTQEEAEAKARALMGPRP